MFIKTKWKGAVAEKKCAELRNSIIKTQDGKIYMKNRNRLRAVKSEETSVEISDNESDNVDDENQVDKLEIKKRESTISQNSSQNNTIWTSSKTT